MLKSLRKLVGLEEAPGDTDSGSSHEEAVRLAAAVLMVEAAQLDGSFDGTEEQTIRAILERHFLLSHEEADALLSRARAHQEEADHLHRFTAAIKDGFSENERTELIELLWEVVYADGELHPYEANLLRRIGGLIYVSDRERGEARKRVTARMGIKKLGHEE